MKRIVGKYVGSVRHGQSGFTLIELLIVLGIIAALAAAVIPNLGLFTGKGEKGGKDTENTNVQAAFDLYMTDNNVSTVVANAGTGSQDWVTKPVAAPAKTNFLSKYLRSTETVYFYCWDAGGKVTKQLDTAVAC